jgi:hypothetical protein
LAIILASDNSLSNRLVLCYHEVCCHPMRHRLISNSTLRIQPKMRSAFQQGRWS